MNEFYEQHALLAILLILWCVVHSALISTYATKRLKLVLKHRVKYYRILYNLIAVFTLVPIFLLWLSMPRVTFFAWTGLWRVLQGALLGAGLFFLLAGAKSYDALQFLGIRQVMAKSHKMGLSDSGGLHTEGILSVVRHPWYLAGILVLWARDLTSVSLIVNSIFTAYLIFGARLEEKKLVQEFGAAYVDYQKRVSMLFPWKWFVEKLCK